MALPRSERVRHTALVLSPLAVVVPVTVGALAVYRPLQWLLLGTGIVALGSLSMVTGSSAAQNHPAMEMSVEDQREDVRPLEQILESERAHHVALGFAVWSLLAMVYIVNVTH